MRGGVARWVDLERSGVSRAALLDAVVRGEIVKVHRGCYAVPDVDRARVLAAVFRAVPTCVTWCATQHLPVLPQVHLTHLAVPRSRAIGKPRQRPVDEVVLHRHAHDHVMAPWQHLDLSALCTSPLEQLVLIDAALNRGLIDPRELQLFRHGSYVRLRRVLAEVDARAQSPLETIARITLKEAGQVATPQVDLDGVGRVDLLVEGRVVVETDGYAFHTDRVQFARDRERDRTLEIGGYAVLRYTSADVLSYPHRIVADVAAAMWRRGWLTPTVRTNLDHAARKSSTFWAVPTASRE